MKNERYNDTAYTTAESFESTIKAIVERLSRSQNPQLKRYAELLRSSPQMLVGVIINYCSHYLNEQEKPSRALTIHARAVLNTLTDFVLAHEKTNSICIEDFSIVRDELRDVAQLHVDQYLNQLKNAEAADRIKRAFRKQLYLRYHALFCDARGCVQENNFKLDGRMSFFRNTNRRETIPEPKDENVESTALILCDHQPKIDGFGVMLILAKDLPELHMEARLMKIRLDIVRLCKDIFKGYEVIIENQRQIHQIIESTLDEEGRRDSQFGI